jgi:hypothetical protein
MTFLKHISISFLLLASFVFLASQAVAQTEEEDVIQFSGQIVYDEDGQLQAIPYANVYIKGSTRGVYSDLDGFFSIVARKNETVVFAYLGFETIEYQIPDTLHKDRYSMVLLMTQDTITLSAVEIYGWPTREHFDIEFLAMDVTEVLEKRAKENLAESVLVGIREDLPMDGGENYSMVQRDKQQEYYAAGQYRPMNILNPLAWAKFIKEWKAGKYKNKNKKK